MGAVYRAEHVLIGKAAAIKVLHPEMSNNKEIVNRFFNEARATTQIHHAGIVEVFDFGYLPSGHAFLVMEFLDGMSMARALKTRGRFGEGDAAMLLRAVSSALAATHAKGIVHRDLKPDNIFLVPDRRLADRRAPQAARLRHREAQRAVDRWQHDAHRLGDGHADVHGAGAVPRQRRRRSPRGSLRDRLHLLRARVRSSAVHQPRRWRADRRAPVRVAREAVGVRADLRRRRRADHGAPREGSPDERPQTARELGQRLQKLAETLGSGDVVEPERRHVAETCARSRCPTCRPGARAALGGDEERPSRRRSRASTRCTSRRRRGSPPSTRPTPSRRQRR